MSIWLTIVAAGLVTYGIRLSFIVLVGHLRKPKTVLRALRYVPPAVLTAMIFPELLLTADTLDISPANPRLPAGLLAAAIAWRTKSVVLTITCGMLALVTLQAMAA